MRTVVAWLVATVSGLTLLPPVVAAPPEDVAAYCRAVYPQVQFQVRCLNVENAAADRVARAVAGADRDAVDRCLTASPSWAAMESCLGQVARAGPIGGGGRVGGVMSPSAPGADPNAIRPQAARLPTGAPGGPGGAPTGPIPGVAGEGGAPTSALGPQAGAVPVPVEPERPTRPIPEADADRQLRALLEREGYPTAQCTKKQYGPGWVIICQ
jgi:hypothetical protein